MVDHAQDGREDKYADGIKCPLVTDVASSNGRFTSGNNDSDVEQHVNDDREDFSDDSERDIKIVRDLMVND